jgi:hypothetical protein
MSDRPYVSFQEVKARIGIPEVLDALGIREQFTEKDGVLTGMCAFPEHRHGPKPNRNQFKINQKDGVWLWHCFGDCNTGGDVIEFVKRCRSLSNEHVRFWFAEHFADRLTLKRQTGVDAPSDPPRKRCRRWPPAPQLLFKPDTAAAGLPHFARHLGNRQAIRCRTVR